MSHPHAHRHHHSFRQELRDAVTPRASLLVLGVLALQLLFITSYVGALHKPKPTDVPFGVAAPRAVAGQTADRLRRLPGAPLDPRTVADEAAARRQILHRDLDGALVVAPAGTTDTLLVASGGGSALATTLERIVGAAEKAEGRTVRTVDVAPASAGDFDGLSSFYLVVGWSVGGYLCASILAISTGARPADPRRASIRLATMALVAIAGGAGGALIVGPALNALPGGVLRLWGLGALVTFAVGAATLALQGIFGVVGIGLAILLVVIAGNPSAGGAFPLPMLPPFWKAIGPALPPGAGTWAARSIAYFRGNALMDALLVLAAWAAAGVTITLLASALRRGRAGAAAGAARPPGAAVEASSDAVRPEGAGVGAHRYGGQGTGTGLVGGGAEAGQGGGGSDAGPVPEGGGAGGDAALEGGGAAAGAAPDRGGSDAGPDGGSSGAEAGGSGAGARPAAPAVPPEASGAPQQATEEAGGVPPGHSGAPPQAATPRPGADDASPGAARSGTGSATPEAAGRPDTSAAAPPETSGAPPGATTSVPEATAFPSESSGTPQAAATRSGGGVVPPPSAPRPAADEAAPAAVGEETAGEGEAAQAAADGEALREGAAAQGAAGGAAASGSQVVQPAAGEEAPGGAPAQGAGRAWPGAGEGDTFVDPGSGAGPGPEAPAARPGPDA
ncbi:hypothetical protein ACE1SV_48300 [Streptomyces sennicomposti]